MKGDRIVTVIMCVVIIAIIAVLGFLGYMMLTQSSQTGSLNIETHNDTNNIIYNNEIVNNNSNNNSSNNANQNTIIVGYNDGNSSSNSNSNSNSNNNTINNNQTIIEPILEEPNITNYGESTLENTISSTYYYNQLDSTAKKIYAGIKKNKENLISGNYIIDFDTEFNTLLNTEGGEEKLNVAFQSAWDAFSYDNVDLFYIDISKMVLTKKIYTLGLIKTYKVTIGPGNNANYFQSSFNSKEDVIKARNYIKDIKRQMNEQISADDIYTKIAKVHNWLVQFLEYENTEGTKDQHTVYGALKNRKAVCEGYAKTFKYFMDGVNVPCVLITGTAKNSQGETESHAWNYVNINNKWYAIDVTWDDPIVLGGLQTNNMRHKYFLKGSKNFLKDHTENGKFTENSITFSFPKLSEEDY